MGGPGQRGQRGRTTESKAYSRRKERVVQERKTGVLLYNYTLSVSSTCFGASAIGSFRKYEGQS